MLTSRSWLGVCLSVHLIACGDDASTTGSTGQGGASSTNATGQGGAAAPPSKCGALCFDSGFDDGTEEDFGNGLVECTCIGTSGAVAKADCESYCATFNVPADKAYLSMNAIADDKCACDGTMP